MKKALIEIEAQLDELVSNQLHIGEDLGEALGLLAGSLLLHRSLKKMGLPKSQRFIAASALIGLAEIRSLLRGIRKELRILNEKSSS